MGAVEVVRRLSDPGEGSTFSVTLAAEPRALRRSSASSRPSHSASQLASMMFSEQPTVLHRSAPRADSIITRGRAAGAEVLVHDADLVVHQVHFGERGIVRQQAPSAPRGRGR